jgi:hypothetical protein
LRFEMTGKRNQGKLIMLGPGLTPRDSHTDNAARLQTISAVCSAVEAMMAYSPVRNVMLGIKGCRLRVILLCCLTSGASFRARHALTWQQTQLTSVCAKSSCQLHGNCF